MFNCDDVLAELSNYLDADLSDSLRKEIEAHMAHCRTCETLYDSARKTLRVVTDSGSFELPENVSTRVVERIKTRIRAAQSEKSQSD